LAYSGEAVREGIDASEKIVREKGRVNGQKEKLSRTIKVW
jgi:hypothetical protein